VDSGTGLIYGPDEIGKLSPSIKKRLVDIPPEELPGVRAMGLEARKAWAMRRRGARLCVCGHRCDSHAKHGGGRCKDGSPDLGRCGCKDFEVRR
jgi:hypothetical protein